MPRLPKSIQQQIDNAQKHYEQPANPEAEATAPETETVEPVAPETATQPTAPEQNADDTKHSQDDEPKRSEGYWEHRFNVINGKYAAEVPVLRDEVKGLKGQLEQKVREITELQQAPSSNPGGLTDEQIETGKEEFGEDFVTFMQKMIDSKAAPKGDISRVKDLEGKLRQFEEREQQKSQASFWTVLAELAPDYRTINADPKFHSFLAQYDPQTGKQRQDDLVAAQQALDADAVASQFNAFKKQQPESKKRIPDDQVDPQSSRSTSAPQGARIWTRPEIKQFYTDKVARRYSADEAQRLEADIFAAQSEGRVQ